MSANVIEIEADEPLNGSLFFSPLQLKVRGRFAFGRCRQPGVEKLRNRYNVDEIPGQRLRLNVDQRTIELVEPLNEPKHEVLREAVSDANFRIPRNEVYRDVHVPTMLHDFKNAVASKLARVAAGQLPDKIDGEPQAGSFSIAQKTHTDKVLDKLAAAIDAQTMILAKLVEASLGQKRAAG